MIAADIVIRPEEPGDHVRVFEINARAFDGPGEARLVEAVRRRPHVVSLVAVAAGHPVGHALFTPVAIDGPAAQRPAMALGPLAVDPEVQNRGIGSQLTRAGLTACAALDEPVVFVLGHPSYYPRFGFRPAAPLGLHYKDHALDGAFMVAELTPGALAGRTGWVRYLPEFDAV